MFTNRQSAGSEHRPRQANRATIVKRNHSKYGAARRPRGAGPAIALATACAVAVSAFAGIGYVLWPRWPQAEPTAGAPTLPITVAGTLFNVPADAIRFPPQRQPGTHARLDLAFQWPELTPPARDVKPALTAEPQPSAQIFVSIAGPQGALPVGERLKTIYPRYMAAAAFPGPGGLAGISFRDGTPYQGEDLLFHPDRPDHFIVRCTRDGEAMPGTCLLERQFGGTEMTVRFPRPWLESWPAVNESIDRLIERLTVRS